MKESLKFKTDELKKSENTAQNLVSERAKIYDNLQVSLTVTRPIGSLLFTSHSHSHSSAFTRCSLRSAPVHRAGRRACNEAFADADAAA